MQAHIAPRCRRDDGRGEVRLLDNAERNVALTQGAEHVVVEPALVTKFDRVATIGRQRLEKRAQPVDVFFEIRWKLKEDRPQAAGERGRVLEQELDGARAFGLEARMVSDPLTRLDRERERI